VKHAILLGLTLAMAAGCHDNKGAEGPAERAGQGVDRAARKTGDALQRAAEKTDAAARKAVRATGAAFEKAGQKLQKNSGATPSGEDKTPESK
jgi:hypothetical protein